MSKYWAKYFSCKRDGSNNSNIDIDNNMAAIHLSYAVGGDFFLGFISAVAFATILAVVSGLTLAGASAMGRDYYVYVYKKGNVEEKNEIYYE